MKNTISWASSLALSTLVALLPLASCQKETRLADQSTPPQTITRTIAAEAEAIESPAETKSVYESGVGVHLTNSEYMSVFYASNDGDETIASMTSILGTPDGTGKWSFSHSATTGTTYDYAFLLPHTSKNEMPSNKSQFKIRLYNVQYPTVTSFDPNMDFLLGKTQLGVSSATSVNNVTFKRLFAPVKVEIYDNANILGTEKVHAVTFSLSKTATNTDALAGLVYVTPGTDDYDSAGAIKFGTDNNNSVKANNFSNAVSALNASGIEKTDGKWSVWYIMNPMEIPSGTNLTLTVTTDTKTVTRTVALTSATAIERNKINRIKFDISGDGYSTETSAYCDFSAMSKADLSDLTASDGTSPLSASGCSIWNDSDNSYYPQALKAADSGVITITPATGKTLRKVRVYTHPVIAFNNSKLVLKADGTALSTKNVVYAEATATAGYLEFEVDADKANSKLTLSRESSNSWLSGITLFYK